MVLTNEPFVKCYLILIYFFIIILKTAILKKLLKNLLLRYDCVVYVV